MATCIEQLDGWKARFEKDSSACGTEDLLEAMAQMAAKQWTGAFNPRPAQADDFLAIYQAAQVV
jgi:alcohol dehydrogenase class IV